MVTLASVEEQLKAVGCNFGLWGRSELKELCHILLDDEKIAMCINGQYEAGFALLCATDRRVLLVDKKPKYLTLKDIRFDMISELDYSHRMMNATINIFTPNKTLRFTAFNQGRLRKLFHHVQGKVMEIRQHSLMQHFNPATGRNNSDGYAPLPQLASDTFYDNQPTFKPNLSRAQNQFKNLFQTHHQPRDETEQPKIIVEAQPEPARTFMVDQPSATAYANMPLIMNGWRRRVYGYRIRNPRAGLQGVK